MNWARCFFQVLCCLEKTMMKWLVIDFFPSSTKDDNEVHCHFLVFFVVALHKTTIFFLLLQ
jgi:hypothetical protein